MFSLKKYFCIQCTLCLLSGYSDKGQDWRFDRVQGEETTQVQGELNPGFCCYRWMISRRFIINEYIYWALITCFIEQIMQWSIFAYTILKYIPSCSCSGVIANALFIANIYKVLISPSYHYYDIDLISLQMSSSFTSTSLWHHLPWAYLT